MSIIVEINSVDVTSQIEQRSLQAIQKITHQVDSAFFNVIKAGSKTLEPAYSDDIIIYNLGVKVFAGKILSARLKPMSGVDGKIYEVRCVDHIYEMDKNLAARVYENQTIAYIIADLISSYAPGFTTTNVTSTFLIEKIVFNQVSLSDCIKRLADIVTYDWYVDEDKDVHFFEKYTNTAPFSITDDNGNNIHRSINRLSDGSEVANRIKVRGGNYNGASFTDDITVVGNETKAFLLPYKFANLTVELNTGAGFVAQDVGIDFEDDFTTDDVLYNFQEQMIQWENPLADGDIIRLAGNPKVPVFAVAEDPVSIGQYGRIEKLIRDNGIESNTIARQRANAELYAFSEPIIDLKFRTYEPGLRAGMLLNVQSDNLGIDDDLIIKELSFKMRDHDSFEYSVSLVSTRRYDFITLLQKILAPEPQTSDERETSEDIFTDTINVTVQEEYEIVNAFEDVDQEVEAEEEYAKIDNFEPYWVLAPFVPVPLDSVLTGLTGRWKMDEGSGASVLDSVGTNHGTNTGAVREKSGPLGETLLFDSATDKIDLDSIITLSGAFSLSFLAIITDNTLSGGICCNQTTYANGRIVINSSTGIEFRTLSGAIGITITEEFPEDNWILLTITRDSSDNIKVYIDDRDVTSGTPNRSGNILVNRLLDNPNNSGWPAFSGYVNDFRIYNGTVLTQANAKTLYDYLKREGRLDLSLSVY